MALTDALNDFLGRNENIRIPGVSVVEGKVSVIGGRSEQQDFLWTATKKDGTRWGIVADGHGEDGARVSKLAVEVLIKEYERLHTQPDFANRAKFSFNRAHAYLKGRFNGGTTATAFDILRKNHRVTLNLAHVGDTKGVIFNLVTNSKIHETRDHVGDNHSEAERVEEAGGFVRRGRVSGILAVTRGLGDEYTGVISEPETTTIELSAGRYLMAICTDGLIKGLRKYLEIKVDADTPVDYILKYFRTFGSTMSMEQITENLVGQAVRGFQESRLRKGKSLRASYGDNVTLVLSGIEVK